MCSQFRRSFFFARFPNVFSFSLIIQWASIDFRRKCLRLFQCFVFIGTLHYSEWLLPYLLSSSPFFCEKLSFLPSGHKMSKRHFVNSVLLFFRRFLQAPNGRSIFMGANCYYSNAGNTCEIVLFFLPLYIVYNNVTAVPNLFLITMPKSSSSFSNSPTGWSDYVR